MKNSKSAGLSVVKKFIALTLAVLLLVGASSSLAAAGYGYLIAFEYSSPFRYKGWDYYVSEKIQGTLRTRKIYCKNIYNGAVVDIGEGIKNLGVEADRLFYTTGHYGISNDNEITRELYSFDMINMTTTKLFDFTSRHGHELQYTSYECTSDAIYYVYDDNLCSINFDQPEEKHILYSLADDHETSFIDMHGKNGRFLICAQRENGVRSVLIYDTQTNEYKLSKLAGDDFYNVELGINGKVIFLDNDVVRIIDTQTGADVFSDISGFNFFSRNYTDNDERFALVELTNAEDGQDNLYKIDVDTGKTDLIVTGETYNVFVRGDELYFSVSGTGIFRSNLDGTGKELFYSIPNYSPTFCGNKYIYDSRVQIDYSSTGEVIDDEDMKTTRPKLAKYLPVDYNADIKATLNDALVLKIGSPDAICDNEYKAIDPMNLFVSPYISQGRTMLPLRFVAEHFGAEVDWDEANSTATIQVGGKTVKFAKDAKQYEVNGEMKTLDVPPEITEDRFMLPIRAFCETVMEKQVFWDDELIIISDKENILDKEKDAEAIRTIKEQFYYLTEPNILIIL